MTSRTNDSNEDVALQYFSPRICRLLDLQFVSLVSLELQYHSWYGAHAYGIAFDLGLRHLPCINYLSERTINQGHTHHNHSFSIIGCRL